MEDVKCPILTNTHNHPLMQNVLCGICQSFVTIITLYFASLRISFPSGECFQLESFENLGGGDLLKALM